MSDPNVRLSRQQLSQFLTNPQAIKTFEELFYTVGVTLPTAVDDTKSAADRAISQAGEALANLAVVADALSLALLSPFIVDAHVDGTYDAAPNNDTAPLIDYGVNYTHVERDLYTPGLEPPQPQELFLPSVKSDFAELSGKLNLAEQSTGILPTSQGGTGVSQAPCFSAWQSVGQSLPIGNTKLQFQSEEFDTANAFDATTTYKFQPAVAGYYFLNLSVRVSVTTVEIAPQIFKNGALFKSGDNPTTNSWQATAGALVYLNGSTDYIEAYVFVSGACNTVNNQSRTFFQGFFINP